MTESASTSPFRRFPWIQLIFCVACLTMTGWTWMRYSYCWSLAPHDWPGTASPVHREDSSWPDRAFVSLDTSGLAWMEVNAYGTEWTVYEGRADRMVHPVYVVMPGRNTSPGNQVIGRAGWSLYREPGSYDSENDDGTTSSITNVLSVGAYSSHRLTGHSAAGLVVGAMGCFIFGLYLRRWLRQRKAVAYAVRMDMLA